MSRWQLEREHRRRIRHALQLLTINGALRPADVEVHYRGTDRVLGTWTGATNQLVSAGVLHQRSLWHTDLRELWHTVWSQLRVTFERAERSRLVKGAPAEGFRMTPS